MYSKIAGACFTVMCLSLVGIPAQQFIADINKGVQVDDALSDVDFKALKMIQKDMDTIAEIQGIDKFDLQLDKIESLKHAGSIEEAQKIFDELMVDFKTDVRFKESFCGNYGDIKLQDIEKLPPEQKEFIKFCIK